MNLHDVLRELIDVAAGTIAHLPPGRAAELHAAVDDDETNTTGVGGPDAAPEPSAYSYEQAPDGSPRADHTAGEPVAG